MRWFGENGRDLARRARGVDESPVVTEHAVKSISQETTFARDVRDDKALADTLRELSAEVGQPPAPGQDLPGRPSRSSCAGPISPP